VSGIVGILHLDRSPIDPLLLQRLTNCQSFRGPDAQQVWIEGHIGFGHTLLKTTDESEHEHQPFTLDGKVWIVADCRVDGRHDLIARLRPHGNEDLADPTDVELILRTYLSWGEDCVERLLGDFAFAIWDAPRQRLFCARDHMGVKPLYYAHVGPFVVFSNSIDCVRQHPAVSNRLNDLAIADFLVFDENQEPGTTCFSDIRRLPPAHLLQCHDGIVSTRRYWALNVTEPVQFKTDREYVERFQNLLNKAVADRMRTSSVGVMMSGGLDSTAVAATAKRLLAPTRDETGLFAKTVVVDCLIPDSERHYAGLAASALNIPIEFQTADNCQLFGHAIKPEYRAPIPEHSAWPDHISDVLRSIAVKSRVALTGQGGDPGFSSRITAHFLDLLRGKQIIRAAKDAARYLSAEGRFSRLYLRGRWRLFFSTKDPFRPYPEWLNEDLALQLKLRDRWMTYGIPGWRAARLREANLVAFRPEASFVMSHVSWQNLFEELDPGVTRVPVEVRHPFFDVRLVAFLLGLPRLPWCCDKELLRQSIGGVLPDAVRLRRKAPLSADPIVALLQKPESSWVDSFEPVPELEHYVRRGRVAAVCGEKSSAAAWVNLRPLSLNFWLGSRAH
jgi:asparagine synthase (glutamine-hydrolysing)